MRIAVIAGHGMGDPGAVSDFMPIDMNEMTVENVEDRVEEAEKSPNVTEHEVVTEIVLYLIDKLDKANIEWFSLNGTLMEKVKACNKLKIDLAIEIHLNAFAGGEAQGAECLIYQYSDIIFTANRILRNLINLGLTFRDIKYRKDLYFLRKTKMPALIVECFFLDNKQEAGLYLNKTEEIAEAIFDGIKDYIERA